MDMFFPSQYKKALISRKKNVTIRYGDEFGKYKKGKIYSAISYSGNDMGVKVKILETKRVSVTSLKEMGINQNTINKLNREQKGFVELIKFEVI
jgi:hypothetical protein